MKYINKTNTFDSHSIPIAQINIITINAIIPTIRTSFTPLSMIFRLFSRNKSFRESQKPMVFIDAETAFANANTIPTEAPNSAPRVRDMIKYIPPIEIIIYIIHTIPYNYSILFDPFIWTYSILLCRNRIFIKKSTGINRTF